MHEHIQSNREISDANSTNNTVIKSFKYNDAYLCT